MMETDGWDRRLINVGLRIVVNGVSLVLIILCRLDEWMMKMIMIAKMIVREW